MYISSSIARKTVRKASKGLLDGLNLPHDPEDIISLTLELNHLTVTVVRGVKVDWEGNRTPETIDYKYTYTGR